MTSMTFDRERHGPARPTRTASLSPTEPAPPLDRSTELALKALEEAEQASQNLPPIVLDEHYLAMITKVEAMDCNRPGTDKTWVHELNDSIVAHFASARRVR